MWRNVTYFATDLHCFSSSADFVYGTMGIRMAEILFIHFHQLLPYNTSSVFLRNLKTQRQ